MIFKDFWEEDILFILKFTALDICVIIDLGWFELTLISVDKWVFLLKGLKELLPKLNVWNYFYIQEIYINW